jgi:hypothetical protein
MADQAPPGPAPPVPAPPVPALPVPRLFRVLQAALVGITLVALWLVAWKIRDAKVEARSGGREKIEAAPAPPAGVVPVPRGGAIRAGHFLLRYPERDGVLEVVKPDGAVVVEFPGLRGGERRGWQELQIEVAASNARTHELRIEFRPGAACRGPGLYRAVKPGLRIEVENIAFSIAAWNGSAGGTIRFDSGSELPVLPGQDTPLPIGTLTALDGSLLIK